MCVKESPRLLARQERERERETERKIDRTKETEQARARESGREVPSLYFVRVCCLCTRVLLLFSLAAFVCCSVVQCVVVCCCVLQSVILLYSVSCSVVQSKRTVFAQSFLVCAYVPGVQLLNGAS